MKKRNMRKQAKILVEHILDKDPISANSIFQKLILEAEEAREEEVADELDLDLPEDDNAETGDTAETNDIEVDVDEDSIDETGDGTIEGMEESSGMSAEESDKIVDDIVEINCQINAKLVSNLFDKIAELKNKIESLGLDENSREYLKYDVSIQYYSDKLQDLQNKTNPGIDQSKVEEAITKIQTAVEQLAGEVNGNSEEEELDIESPEEVAAKNDLAEDEEDSTEAETDGETAADTEATDEEIDTDNDSTLNDESEAEEETETSDDEVDELFS
jgi:hypothetical protein